MAKFDDHAKFMDEEITRMMARFSEIKRSLDEQMKHQDEEHRRRQEELQREGTALTRLTLRDRVMVRSSWPQPSAPSSGR